MEFQNEFIFWLLFCFWLSWASHGWTWASLGNFWAALGSCSDSLGSSWASLTSAWGHLGSLLTRIGSLLAHPVPAVPHLEPPWSRHRDSLASSWSLTWPIRLPRPLIFPSAVASGCMINSDPSWRFRFWTHVKSPVPQIGALRRLLLDLVSSCASFCSSRGFSSRVLTKSVLSVSAWNTQVRPSP